MLTQPAEETKKADYIAALVGELSGDAARCAHHPDRRRQRHLRHMFHELLTEETELGRLLSYAGFLDMAIVTGTALSHGVARYAFLHHGEQTEATERAFPADSGGQHPQGLLLQEHRPNDILSFVRNDLQGNADNFWDPDIDRAAILARLESGMEAAAAPVIANLERSNLHLRPAPHPGVCRAGLGRRGADGLLLPLGPGLRDRMDIRLGDFTEPHESVLGIYYR